MLRYGAGDSNGRGAVDVKSAATTASRTLVFASGTLPSSAARYLRLNIAVVTPDCVSFTVQSAR